MAKPRIIIADLEEDYVLPLKQRFADAYLNSIHLEIITNARYFEELFARPQKVDILIVSGRLYSPNLLRHDVKELFVLDESDMMSGRDARIKVINKYTSIKDVFGRIVQEADKILNGLSEKAQDTLITVVTSAVGGAGKTTVAMGLAAALTDRHKRVLYINAECFNTFQAKLKNAEPISNQAVYIKLASGVDNVYSEIEEYIRKDGFSYVPPFKNALSAYGIPFGIYVDIIKKAKATKEYDHIIVDTDSNVDAVKAELIALANNVIYVTTQEPYSGERLEMVVSALGGKKDTRKLFICNKYSATKERNTIQPYGINYKINEKNGSELSEIESCAEISEIAFVLD